MEIGNENNISHKNPKGKSKTCKNIILQHLQTDPTIVANGVCSKKKKNPVSADAIDISSGNSCNKSKVTNKSQNDFCFSYECIDLRKQLLADNSKAFKDQTICKKSNEKSHKRKVNVSKSDTFKDVDSLKDIDKSVKTPYTSLVAEHKKDSDILKTHSSHNKVNRKQKYFNSKNLNNEKFTVPMQEKIESQFSESNQIFSFPIDVSNCSLPGEKCELNKSKKNIDLKDSCGDADSSKEKRNARKRKQLVGKLKNMEKALLQKATSESEPLVSFNSHRISKNNTTIQENLIKPKEKHLLKQSNSNSNTNLKVTVVKKASKEVMESGTHQVVLSTKKNINGIKNEEVNSSQRTPKKENSRQRRSRHRQELNISSLSKGQDSSKETHKKLGTVNSGKQNNSNNKNVANFKKNRDNKHQCFESYLSEKQVMLGLRNGELIEGVIRINPKNYEDAYVALPDSHNDIYIGGLKNRNRALNGDIVIVRINPQTEWRILHSEHMFPEEMKKLDVSQLPDLDDDWIETDNLNNKIKYENDNNELHYSMLIDENKKIDTESYVQQENEKSLINFNESDSLSDEGKGVAVAPEDLSEYDSQESVSQKSDHSIDWTQPIEDAKFWEDYEKWHAEGRWERDSPVEKKELTDSHECGILVDLSVDKVSQSEINFSEYSILNDFKELDIKGNSVKITELEESPLNEEKKLENIGNNSQELLIKENNNPDVFIEENLISVCESDINKDVNSLVDKFSDNHSETKLVHIESDQEQNICHYQKKPETFHNNNSQFQFKYSDFLEELLPIYEMKKSDNSLLSVNSIFGDLSIPDLDSQINLCQNVDDVVVESSSNASEEVLEPNPLGTASEEVLEPSPPNTLFFDAVTFDIVALPSLEVINENGSIVNRASNKLRKKIRHHRKKPKQLVFASPIESLPEKHIQKTGKVVYILQKKHSRAAAGHIKLMQDKNSKFAFFCPVDHRLPRMKIPLSDCPSDFIHRPDDFAKILFIARIVNWNENSGYALGHLDKSLGNSGDIEPETDAILIENDIDFSEFPSECVSYNLPWTIPQEEYEKRKDLRNNCIFTIDPVSARDMDDAVSCKNLGDGLFEVGVHIADVSYFVKDNTSLDHIASQRATSVYLVQKVIPMLPRVLCEQLCSLTQGEDRLTFSVIWQITEKGQIINEWFGHTIINSCAKLNYDHAQFLIDHAEEKLKSEEFPYIFGDHSISDIQKAILELNGIARHLRSQRFSDGALRLDQVKISFVLNQETGLPNGYYVYEQKDSHKLIEEFMLLANMAVAKKIYDTFPSQALLRCHPPPNYRMLDEIADLCSVYDIWIDTSTAGSIQESLSQFIDGNIDNLSKSQILTVLFSKPMQMARYFCSGCVSDVSKYHHYALNVPLYTHFTSPIRRYADIIVHRLMKAALIFQDEISYLPDTIQKVANRCNDRKTASKRAQDLSNELYFAAFIKECGPLEETGMVISLMDHSFDVLILKLGIIKRLYCNNLPLNDAIFSKNSNGKMSLILVWKEEIVQEYGIEQEQTLNIFSMINIVLLPSKDSLKFTAVIKYPSLKKDRAEFM